MSSVFVFYREQGADTCILLHEDQAERFLKSSVQFVEEEYNGGELVGYWAVPEEVINNVTASGNVRNVFDAVVGLDVLMDEPKVSDLLATIFAAGFELGRRRHNV